jgi:hypothetical protein
VSKLLVGEGANRHDQVTSGEGDRGEWNAEYWTKAPPKQFVLKRDGIEGTVVLPSW